MTREHRQRRRAEPIYERAFQVESARSAIQRVSEALRAEADWLRGYVEGAWKQRKRSAEGTANFCRLLRRAVNYARWRIKQHPFYSQAREPWNVARPLELVLGRMVMVAKRLQKYETECFGHRPPDAERVLALADNIPRRLKSAARRLDGLSETLLRELLDEHPDYKWRITLQKRAAAIVQGVRPDVLARIQALPIANRKRELRTWLESPLNDMAREILLRHIVKEVASSHEMRAVRDALDQMLGPGAAKQLLSSRREPTRWSPTRS